MTFLLNFIYFFVLLLFSPILCYRIFVQKKYRQGLAEKWLGLVPRLDPPRKGKKRIWLHAVSVGEMNLLKPILKIIDERYPNWECVISTTSKTGMELGRRIYSNRILFYCPLDFSFAVKNALRRLQPDLLVLAELELWPNLILCAKKQSVRLAIINGRISEKSLKKYRWIRFFTRFILQKFDLVAAQDSWNAVAFEQLGRQSVTVTGSIKFDGVQSDRQNTKTIELARLAGLNENETIFLAGSTQEPEEFYALSVYKKLRTAENRLRLILVPRHPERFDAVADLLAKSGLPWRRRSLFEQEGIPPQDTVLLIDTIGELGAWWGTAQIAFVGGSFGSRGGQNMLEPAAYGAAVSFGPNTKNFRDIVALMLRHNAAVVLPDQVAMESFVKRCIDDKVWRTCIGNNAQSLVAQNLGAAEKTCTLLPAILLSSK